MVARTITKHLAGEEDLLLGEGTEVQTRGGTPRTMTKVRITVPIRTVADLRNVDPDLHISAMTFGKVVEGDGASGRYYWDPLSSATDDGHIVVSSNVSPTGRWIIIGGYGSGITLFDQVISSDFVIPAGSNGLSVNPTVASGVTVTVSAGSEWHIVGA